MLERTVNTVEPVLRNILMLEYLGSTLVFRDALLEFLPVERQISSSLCCDALQILLIMLR